MESPFFFENNSHSIFGILHAPSGENTNAGFVFCYPFAPEAHECRRIYTLFARRLASIGYYVLRFNYMGTGDSGGNFEDATVETRVSDIIKAAAVLREKSGVQRIGLLGMRLGATWAGLAAVESAISVAPLILWNPIVDVKKFFNHGFRQSITFQSVIFREILFDRKRLIEKLISDGKVTHQGYKLNVIDGYPISQDFYIQSINIDLPARIRYYSGNVLIAQIDKSTTPFRNELVDLADRCGHDGKITDLTHVEEPVSWWTMEGKERTPKPNEIFNITENWISGIMEDGG